MLRFDVKLALLSLLACGCKAPDGDELFRPSAGSGGAATGGGGGEAGSSGGSGGSLVNEPDAGGSGGSGGSVTADGGTSAGGTGAGGSGTADGFGQGTACVALADPLLTDFDLASSNDASEFSFGDATHVSGTLFAYPTEPNAFALNSEISDGQWRLSGEIGDYAGFGLSLNCNGLDASQYTGIAFRLRARIDAPGGLRLTIATASNQVSHVWLNSHKASPDTQDVAPNFGVCLPASSQYDGTCVPAFTELPTGDDEVDIFIPWSDFSGGSPDSAVDPARITSFLWELTAPPNVRTPEVVPYDADIRIDELHFERP